MLVQSRSSIKPNASDTPVALSDAAFYPQHRELAKPGMYPSPGTVGTIADGIFELTITAFL